MDLPELFIQVRGSDSHSVAILQGVFSIKWDGQLTLFSFGSSCTMSRHIHSPLPFGNTGLSKLMCTLVNMDSTFQPSILKLLPCIKPLNSHSLIRPGKFLWSGRCEVAQFFASGSTHWRDRRCFLAASEDVSKDGNQHYYPYNHRYWSA